MSATGPLASESLEEELSLLVEFEQLLSSATHLSPIEDINQS